MFTVNDLSLRVEQVKSSKNASPSHCLFDATSSIGRQTANHNRTVLPFRIKYWMTQNGEFHSEGSASPIYPIKPTLGGTNCMWLISSVFVEEASNASNNAPSFRSYCYGGQSDEYLGSGLPGGFAVLWFVNLQGYCVTSSRFYKGRPIQRDIFLVFW